MANGFGLYDMAGNVREWVWDLYDSSLNYYQTCSTNNPKGYDGGTERIVRGGSFLSGLDELTVYNIDSIAPTTAEEGTGFRCVRAK
jgi:formylglycine-generating enzyme required for sulfatase activity